jgi:hypothetical protein
MIKTILAHLSGTPCDASVLAASLACARLHKAHITCLHVSPDPADLVQQAAQIDPSNAMLLADALQAMEQESKERRAEATAVFAGFCKRENIATAESQPANAAVSASWQDKTGQVADSIGAEGRFHDLVVLAGGPERNGRLSAGDLGRIILSCGRPVLLAPERARTRSFDTIAIAWKNTSEAARAITAAMPFLMKTKRIEILSANEGNSGALECVNCSEGLVRQLHRHGLDAQARFVMPAGRGIPDAILETARERQADLFVMGAYGHSRLREFIFGGFTRRILDGVDFPVLLFH